MVALGAWALASPVGASPDDDFHLASIWCGLGERDGLCEAAGQADEREIPADLGGSACYAFDRTTSGACQGDDFGETPLELNPTDRGNFAGLYPPIYYAVAGVFATDAIEASTLAIRLANGVLFVGLLTLLAALLPAQRRVPAVLAVVVTVVPLSIFLLASTNPSSWAITSAAILLPALLGFFDTTGARRVGLGALAVLSAVIGSGARADAAIFAGLAVVAAVVIAFPQLRRAPLLATLPAAILVLSIALYFSASQGDAVSTGLSETTPPGPMQVLGLLLANGLEVPSLWIGVFGTWGLGWLDTPLPQFVWMAGTAVFVAVLWRSAASLNRRTMIVAIGLLAAAWAFPMYLLIQTQAFVGAYVQPRYILPLLVMLAFVVLLDNGSPLPRAGIAIGGAALVLAHALALHTDIRRYTVGLDQLVVNLDSVVEWWWPVGPSPMTVWLVGSVAFAAVLAGLAWQIWPRQQPQASGPVGIAPAN